ncbi:hypothetical protein D7S86_01735 [Pararobbsia silviterrae]|uniref:Uncharacterized protein n=1 Tax=Pararobbsia silviterrae TaxID=1792498 RepID=A0A494YF61_9BURK|nr:hypothetical protein D7S86_01735 [Pararobbsia silviterrae]
MRRIRVRSVLATRSKDARATIMNPTASRERVIDHVNDADRIACEESGSNVPSRRCFDCDMSE